MNFITLYESASTDGYHTQGDGRYFLSKSEAEKMNDQLGHAGHGRVIEHNNCIMIDGIYFELKSRSGIMLSKTIDEERHIKKQALSKLTLEEQHLLGLL